ncbi:MAG: PSD1 and planctomycete cytochrome C domain-containing protein [Gemmataceae bacterium]|nr:PSD1 and planctomycete cytochrome C domain-containing protein [Gemmataceae bacterium]
MRYAPLLPALIPLLLWTAPGQPAEPSAEGVEFFEKKIRPVLVDQCMKCHSGAKPKGKLLLDSRAALLKGGDSGPSIVVGEPDKSLLLKAIRYTDDELRMPPKTKLADAAIADFAAWIKMGAPWPDGGNTSKIAKEFDLQERKKFWCWQPIQTVQPPAVKRKEWAQTPIDAFVLAKLESNGLVPAKAAERRTLVRRVTYDLIGLPPTPEDMEAALSDKSDKWFETVVDRLLASPHYGERWGRHWLDLVRFAETYGHEFDYDIPEAYQYRDYVIRALNADVPYNQLVLEHVAGDLLSDPRRHPTDKFNESILGTGFWFLGEAKHSPVDVRIDEAERIDNQIDVMTKAFLGLTVSCARCHDHKFDAISTKDYHALMGYMQSSRPQRAFIDAPERSLTALRELKEAQTPARTQAVALMSKLLRGQAEKFAEHLRSAKVDAKGIEHPLYPWLALNGAKDFTAKRDEVLKQLQAQQVRTAEHESRAVVFTDFAKDGYQDWFVTGDAFGSGPARGEVLLGTDAATPVQGVVFGAAHSGVASPRLQGVLRSRSFVISRKTIAYRMAGKGARVNLVLDGLQLIQSPIYGGLKFDVNSDEPRWHTMDVSMWQGNRAYIEVIDDGAGYARLDRVLFTDDGPPPAAPSRLIVSLLDNVDSPNALAQRYQDLCVAIADQWGAGSLPGTADAGERMALLNWMLQNKPFVGALSPSAERDKLAALLETCKRREAQLPQSRRALTMADGNGWTPRVYIRGNPKNLGEEVPRRFLEAIVGNDAPSPPPLSPKGRGEKLEGSGRLELARRMVDSANPLTARVMVNRLWHHHFGAGLVRSVDNFGVLGEEPSHPELLDWLATEFVRQGWSLKKMHRLLLLSSTYQMASRADDAAAEQRDPQNRLLHRMPIRRLEAEAIRDAVLSVSGRLDPRMYGPSVLPHLTPHMSGRGRPGASGPLDGNGRRSIYINVRRNFLTPLFLSFDYPIPFTTIGRRSVSNVPAQALALMNNPFVVQQADTWAKRVLAEPNLAPKQRVTRMYEMAFGRPPSEAELNDTLEFLEEQGKQYGKGNEAKAWSDLGHVLFNVKEFIFVN